MLGVRVVVAGAVTNVPEAVDAAHAPTTVKPAQRRKLGAAQVSSASGTGKGDLFGALHVGSLHAHAAIEGSGPRLRITLLTADQQDQARLLRPQPDADERHESQQLPESHR